MWPESIRQCGFIFAPCMITVGILCAPTRILSIGSKDFPPMVLFDLPNLLLRAGKATRPQNYDGLHSRCPQDESRSAFATDCSTGRVYNCWTVFAGMFAGPKSSALLIVRSSTSPSSLSPPYHAFPSNQRRPTGPSSLGNTPVMQYHYLAGKKNMMHRKRQHDAEGTLQRQTCKSRNPRSSCHLLYQLSMKRKDWG